MTERVVVTGVGLITPVGVDRATEVVPQQVTGDGQTHLRAGWQRAVVEQRRAGAVR